MKAVLINKAGFHKHIHVAKKVSHFRQLNPDSASLYKYEELNADKERELFVPIVEFLFEREYEDEWGETVLIYREYGA